VVMGAFLALQENLWKDEIQIHGGVDGFVSDLDPDIDFAEFESGSGPVLLKIGGVMENTADQAEDWIIVHWDYDHATVDDAFVVPTSVPLPEYRV